jgi:hypothetical protein
MARAVTGARRGPPRTHGTVTVAHLPIQLPSAIHADRRRLGRRKAVRETARVRVPAAAPRRVWYAARVGQPTDAGSAAKPVGTASHAADRVVAAGSSPSMTTPVCRRHLGPLGVWSRLRSVAAGRDRTRVAASSRRVRARWSRGSCASPTTLRWGADRSACRFGSASPAHLSGAVPRLPTATPEGGSTCIPTTTTS